MSFPEIGLMTEELKFQKKTMDEFSGNRSETQRIEIVEKLVFWLAEIHWPMNRPMMSVKIENQSLELIQCSKKFEKWLTLSPRITSETLLT